MKGRFLRPNRFKLIFSLLFIGFTGLVFFLGANSKDFNTTTLDVVFALLYFPAAIFAFYFSQLPMFKTCSPSLGQEMCVYNQGVAVWLSIPVFLIYVYALACVLDAFVMHRKKPVRPWPE
jgi:hypothetical protein